jgi:hypothetical protein
MALFVILKTNANKKKNNIQFSRTAIAEKQYFHTKQNLFNILMQE